MIKHLTYKTGYKFMTHDEYRFDTGIIGRGITLNKFLTLTGAGELIIASGYAWDGATRAINNKSIIRGSLIHDALYQLMREDALPFSYKKRVDDLFIEICKEDGMWAIRRTWVRAAIATFGANAIAWNNPVLFAPEKIK